MPFEFPIKEEKTPEVSIEETESFSIDEKEGQEALLAHLHSLAETKNSILDTSLDLDTLEWPAKGIEIIKEYRIGYADLCRKLQDCIEFGATEEELDTIVEMYGEHGALAEAFDDYQSRYLAGEFDGQESADGFENESAGEANEPVAATEVVLEEPLAEVDQSEDSSISGFEAKTTPIPVDIVTDEPIVQPEPKIKEQPEQPDSVAVGSTLNTQEQVVLPEPEQPASLVEAAENLPSEDEVRQAVEQLENATTLTPEEWQTARMLQSVYERSVEKKDSPEVIVSRFESFRDHVEHITADTKPKVLRTRIEAMLEKVAHSKSLDPDLLQSVQAMKDQFKRQVADESTTQEQLKNTFNLIEQLTEQGGANQMTLAGMRPPQAGPEHVFAARSFREAIKLEPELLPSAPDSVKQTLLRKIMKKLAYVPDTGLSKEDAAEIASLAREADSLTEGKEDVQTESNDSPVETDTQPEQKLTPAQDEASPVEDEKEAEVKNRHETESDIDAAEDDLVVLTPFHKSRKLSVPEDLDEGPVSIQTPDDKTDYEDDEDDELLVPEEGFDEKVSAAEIEPKEKPQTRESSETGEVRNTSIEHAKLTPREQLTEKEQVLEKLLTTTQKAKLQAEGKTLRDFGKLVESRKNQLNTKAASKFSQFLGEKPGNTYAYLENMTMAEITKLMEADRAERQATLQAHNVTYDEFLVWTDEIAVLKKYLTANNNEPFKNVFTAWVAFEELGE